MASGEVITVRLYSSASLGISLSLPEAGSATDESSAGPTRTHDAGARDADVTIRLPPCQSINQEGYLVVPRATHEVP